MRKKVRADSLSKRKRTFLYEYISCIVYYVVYLLVQPLTTVMSCTCSQLNFVLMLCAYLVG